MAKEKAFISCMNCGQKLPSNWVWYVCNECGYRICPSCLGKHKGEYAEGGFKCSQCAYGYLEKREG